MVDHLRHRIPGGIAIVVALAAAFAAVRWVSFEGNRAERRPAAGVPVAPTTVTMEVGGMVCAGCVAKVELELARVPGVRRVEIDLARRRADILCEGAVPETALTAAVRRAGPQYLGLVLAP